MKYGGIDIGFDRCGLAVIEHGKALEYKTIQTSNRDHFAERLLDVEYFVNEFFSKYSPGNIMIGIEVPTFAGRNTNAGKVHQVLGVVMAALYRIDHDYVEHSPSHVKAAVSSGNATKTQVKNAVDHILGIPSFKGVKDDAIDALAIAICTQLDHLKAAA